MNPQAAQHRHFDGLHCKQTIEKLSHGVVILKISGTDVGEFGDAPMLELQKYLDGGEPIQLFIDARDVRGASIDVSAEWAAWLRAHRTQLREISMLTGSRYIEITADFVRRFAALEGMMRIYTEPGAFDAALTESLA